MNFMKNVFKIEVKGQVFQTNDNNRKVLFNTPHMPHYDSPMTHMIALSLVVK